jgi:hypothetical protein
VGDVAADEGTVRCGRDLPYAPTSAALQRLPYGPGATVRHVVGSAAGGGYEWQQTAGPVRRGGTALELDQDGCVAHFTAVWDGHARLST